MNAILNMLKSRRISAGVALLAAIIIFLAVNIAANSLIRTARLDLTQEGLFTLSDGSRNILSELDEPVTLRLYYSESLAASYPALRSIAERVRDTLTEIESAGGGNIVFEMIDPEPFSEDEDKAATLGVQGQPTQDGEVIYFGLVGTNAVDGREIIPYFTAEREAYLEYDIISMVYRLSGKRRPILGIVTNLPLDTGPGGMEAALQGRAQPYVIYEYLQQVFDPTFLEQDFDRVPENIDALLIAHTKTLNDRTLYAIDQFVMRGGRVIAVVDPISEISRAASPTGDPLQGSTFSSDLPRLFASWGVSYKVNEVVADRTRAMRVQAGSDLRRLEVDYVPWLALLPEDFDVSDIAMANVGSLNLATSGHFTRLDGATTRFAPLIASTPQAMVVDSAELMMAPDPDGLLARFLPTGQRYVMAARLSGLVRSAFPDGAPPPQAPAEGQPAPLPLPAHLAEAADANIIVIADSDIFDDRFWVQVGRQGGQRVAQAYAGNGDFLVGAIENMLGSNDLISLRARSVSARPFTVVEELRKAAETRFLAEEQRLQAKLEATAARIQQLQQLGGDGSTAMMTPEQQAEVEGFRAELASTRAELRAVQRNLRRDVESLGSSLAFINIALVPLLLVAASVFLAILRNRRRARATKVH